MPDLREFDQLLARMAAGDDEALRLLIVATLDELRGFVAVLARRADLVEDVVHDTYVDAALAAARYQPGRSVMAWLKGIARHRLQRRLRDDGRRARRFDPQDLAASELTAVLGDPSEAMTRDEDQRLNARALRACLAALPDHARDLVERFYQHGQSLTEIALAAGRQPQTVAKALSRTRLVLRACLEREGVEG
jgi:RNA polymerase sigma-70 factor (ECF subfamily)